MFEIEEKKILYLLILLPVLVGIYLLNWFWKAKKRKQFADNHLFENLAPEVSVFKNVLKFSLLIGALVLIIIALVNPKMGTKVKDIKRQGIDIVFAVDVSKSMLAEDVAPNRLEKTKQIVNQIINQLGTDRIGIIGYAGSAYPVLPITTDYSVAKMYLQNMNTSMVSSQGTALNDAIKLATTYFDDPETSKLIILISDGEDHSEGAEETAEEAKDKGIKIITIGVGTTNGGPIPLRKNGTIEGYKKDKAGETVVTKLYPETLENIAKKTNGGYIYGGNTKEVLEKLKNAMDNIEKTDFETQQIAEFQSQYQWFLALAFLLLFIDVFLLDKITHWVSKLNLFK